MKNGFTSSFEIYTAEVLSLHQLSVYEAILFVEEIPFLIFRTGNTFIFVKKVKMYFDWKFAQVHEFGSTKIGFLEVS